MRVDAKRKRAKLVELLFHRGRRDGGLPLMNFYSRKLVFVEGPEDITAALA
jgi:hypothetical protein